MKGTDQEFLKGKQNGQEVQKNMLINKQIKRAYG